MLWGKAGQTTGVSASTHGSTLSIWAVYYLSHDHILFASREEYLYGDLLLHHFYCKISHLICILCLFNRQASVSVVVLPTPVFPSRSSGCAVSVSCVVSSTRCVMPRRSTSIFTTLFTFKPRVTSLRTSVFC